MSINNIDKIMSYISPVSVSDCDHLYLNEKNGFFIIIEKKLR